MKKKLTKQPEKKDGEMARPDEDALHKMLPYQLDAILSRRSKRGWVCPKCGHGMDYVPVASSSVYACRNEKCKRVQFEHPKRGKIKA